MLRDTNILVDIIDLNGRRIERLYNGKLNAGNHNFTWNGKNNSKNIISSGVYYIKVASEVNQEWKMVTVIK